MTVQVKPLSLSDGMSATLCVVLGAFVFLLVHHGVMQESAVYIALGCAIVAMGFFWSALWKTRCRDLWAWCALLLAIFVLSLPFWLSHISRGRSGAGRNGQEAENPQGIRAEGVRGKAIWGGSQ